MVFIVFWLLCSHCKNLNANLAGIIVTECKNSQELANFNLLFLLHQVCKEVTETYCEIQLYKECQWTMTKKTVPFNEQVIDTFIPWKCTEGRKLYNNKKYDPICKPEDRKDCTQVWKEKANGEKVQ